jgi:hypothetical protein
MNIGLLLELALEKKYSLYCGYRLLLVMVFPSLCCAIVSSQ